MSSVHELLLLGLLADGEAHGYELHEFLAEKLHFLTDLTRPTAYRLLDRLHQEGLLDREVEREGKRPERMRYRITDKGRETLDTLLREQLADIDMLKPSGNVALLFSQRVPAKEAAELLKKRRDALSARRDRLSAHLDELAPENPARIVLDRNLALLEADITWLERRIAQLCVAAKHTDEKPARGAHLSHKAERRDSLKSRD